MSGAVAQTHRYKNCFFYSPDFVGDNSWNGYEHNLLFENLNNGLYTDVARPLGCDEVKDSRGLAVADLDNDGRLDMIVANNDDPPTVYLNRMQTTGAWLNVSLVGSAPHNLDAVGARVRITIDVAGRIRKLSRWVEIGSGYSSQSDLRLHFGLGDANSIQQLEVLWPGGSKVMFEADQLENTVNRAIRVQQGVRSIERLNWHSEPDVADGIPRGMQPGPREEVSSL